MDIYGIQYAHQGNLCEIKKQFNKIKNFLNLINLNEIFCNHGWVTKFFFQ